MPSPFTYIHVASVTPLQRYSDFCAPPICEKLLLYLYIYINIKSILGGWDREKFYCNAVTL